MNYLLLIVVCIIVIAFIYIKASPEWKTSNNDEDSFYDEETERIKNFVFKKSSFLTRNESNFYSQLQEYLKEQGVLIFANVRLPDIFGVRDQKTNPEAFWVFSKIKAKHIDFVITDKEGWRIKLCIELDDSTHDIEKKGDIYKNKLFETMEIPFLRFKTAHTYDLSEVWTILSTSQ